MAYQNARPVKKPAQGNAKNTGAPGPTPAPVKYVNPTLNEKDFKPGYGTNHFTGASSVAPGQTAESDLARDLRSKAAQGDAGDLLGRIASRGTTRGNAAAVELQSPQTRDVDDSPYPTAHGMRNRSGEGAKVPDKLGQAVFDPNSVRKPGT